MQSTEELGTVEIRGFQADGIPRQEVGRPELVAAFIEVGANGFTIQRGNPVEEESGIGNDEGDLPIALSYSFFKVFAA